MAGNTVVLLGVWSVLFLVFCVCVWNEPWVKERRKQRKKKKAKKVKQRG